MAGDRQMKITSNDKTVQIGGMNIREVFKFRCVNWPHNIPEKFQRKNKTGGCCWQFVNDGD